MRTWLPLGVRRALVYTHRWLGIVGCMLFLAWFVSGIVLMYARMPRLTPDERRAAQPHLDLSSARVSIAEAARIAGVTPDRVRIGMHGQRPVYRLLSRGRWITVFADQSDVLNRLTDAEAVAVATKFATARARSGVAASVVAPAAVSHEGLGLNPSHGGLLEDADQWTFDLRGQMPIHRISLGDADGTVVYVSDRTGEVVLDTTAAERRAGYAGAVIHWIYFTPFRRNSGVWAQTIIWSSVLGCVMCLTGLVWGVWRYSPRKTFRLKREQASSPYAGWMRWHHYAGLFFGLTTFTWTFSGLLSMDPWDWHPSTAPTRAQREAFSGGPLRLGLVTADVLRHAAAKLGDDAPRELDIVQFRGEPYVAAGSRLVSVTNLQRPVVAPFDLEAILGASIDAAAHDAEEWSSGGPIVQSIGLVREYDAYYYDRNGELPLPVVQIRYADPARTWLYVDPRRGEILRKEERLTRVNRWLYHGLHSLDFPFLYYRRPLWDIVVIVLSVGGIASTVTTVMPALRRLKRLYRRFSIR
jgi:uncharacterized iron-regulated membrane protein